MEVSFEVSKAKTRGSVVKVFERLVGFSPAVISVLEALVKE